MPPTNVTQKNQELSKARHPEYIDLSSEWIKWRLCYEGGTPFRNAFLERYSKREDPEDFNLRKKLTYIPAHARSAINIIRNALAVQLPDVERNGSERYKEYMATNVDGFNNSMTSFLVLDIIPLLLTQGKRFVVVDAPPAPEGRTRAEDYGAPYYYTLNAENMLSWTYDEDGNFLAVLLELTRDKVDPNTGLTIGAEQIYRYMAYVDEAPTDECVEEGAKAPGVFVKTMDRTGKTVEPCRILQVSRVPIVEFRLVASLMGEIAEHQISLLNLASTDMDFLWRGNFPIYTEQRKKGVQGIRARGTKANDDIEGTAEDTLRPSDTAAGREKKRRVGVNKGVQYIEGLERPDFISPGVENLKVSMEKQDVLIKDIRTLVDLALVSLSVKAVEQSGASKMADRIGADAGLAYIGRALESGERDLVELWHELNGETNVEIQIKYPQNYTMKTEEERLNEAKKLSEMRSAVRSPMYQREIDKRVTTILLQPISTEREIKQVHIEIDKAPYFDDDKQRAEIVQKDATAGLVSNATASVMRGYDDAEAAKAALEEQQRLASVLAGSGEGRLPVDQNEDEDEDDEDGEDGEL